MIVLKPLSTKYLPHKDLTTFFFEGPERPSARDFFVRGAIAWPEELQQGFALLAGQDPKTKVVYIFEEYPFWTVGHYLAEDALKHPGLGQFLLDVWAKYHCHTFYRHQHPEVHRRFSLQAYDDKTIAPKPELIDVPTVERLGDTLVVEYGRTRKLVADQRMTLKQQLTQHFAVPEAKNPGMGVHALRCLLAGFEHAGWAEPRRPQAERIHLLGRLSEMRSF